jgi:hypothetical protein
VISAAFPRRVKELDKAKDAETLAFTPRSTWPAFPAGPTQRLTMQRLTIKLRPGSCEKIDFGRLNRHILTLEVLNQTDLWRGHQSHERLFSIY